MESTRSKVEVMKPVLLKAGIPLAFSVVGFIIARLTTRKISFSKAFQSENQVNSLTTDSCKEFRDEGIFHSPDSTPMPCTENEEQLILAGTHFSNPLPSLLNNRDRSDILEEDNLGLRCQIEELQQREWQLETRFLHYCNMKDQELLLMETHGNLLMEMARVEFLAKEVSSMEAENRRFEELVMEYLRMLEQLEFSRLENGLLQRKVKKLSRKTKGLYQVISEQNMQIEGREAEVLRNLEDLEVKANVVKSLEDQITELQSGLDQLQLEKEELLNKLELAENSNSASSKIEAEETITLEDYNKLVNELEQVKNDRAVEIKELIFLRWSNACLRYELMRRTQEQEEQKEERDNHLDFGGSREIGKFGLENIELDGSVVGHGGVTMGDHAHSKRPKFIRKLKRWVEGCEKVKQKLDEKDRHEVKCFGRSNLVCDGPEEQHLPPRKSCSSA